MQSRRIASLALALAACMLVLTGAACHGTRRAEDAATTASVPPVCPPGAEPQENRCACRGDLRLLLGACVSARTASEYCGPTAFATAGGCVLRPRCEPGRARELVSSECLARRDVRNLAASLGILVADDELLGCPTGSELAALTGDEDEGSLRLGCVPRAVRPSGGPPCPAGSFAVSTRCESLLRRRSSGGPPEVDVVRWVEATIGADGGPGAPPLCSAWARAPAFLGSATPLDARFGVTLLFADNDVSLVVAEVAEVGRADTAAATELDRVLRPMVEALRALGGTASQASMTTTVRCVRTAGARPSSVPAENDHER